MRIRDVLGAKSSQEVVTIKPEAGVRDLIARLAEHNVAVDQVTGSGKRGQVLKGDVLEAIARGAPSQPGETPRVAASGSEAPSAARPASPPEDAGRSHRWVSPPSRLPGAT